MNNKLKKIEDRAGGVQPARKLLGISQNMFYVYRRKGAVIPDYIKLSVEAHMLLTDEQFNRLLKRRAK